MNRDMSINRFAMYEGIRGFFKTRGILEVETPALSPSLIPEPSIPYFKTTYDNPFAGSLPLYLVPSPEVWMKRLLADGSGSIFQICKCFRNGEALGSHHNPEFSMLEWYLTDADYKANITLTEELIAELAALSEFSELTLKSPGLNLEPPFIRMTMEEAFKEFAEVELASCETAENLAQAGERIGITVPPEDSWEQAFNRIFLSCVEPNLPSDRPLVLMDYPARVPCLAKRIPGTPWLERWELYVRGMELANCFTEEKDLGAAAAYFRHACEGDAEAARDAALAADPDFTDIFGPGFPSCSGVAMGLDRLLMVLTGTAEINEVLLFPPSGTQNR